MMNENTPDIIVVFGQEKVKTDSLYGVPDLVVEVLSHSAAC